MAATKTATLTAPDLEATATRINELNEKFVEAAKKNGKISLDIYEKNLADALQFSQQAADSTEIDAISSITKAQNDYITAVTKVWTGVARDALK